MVLYEGCHRRTEMTITTSQAQGSVPVTILSIQGDLDASNYQEVIAVAKEAYDEGARHMVIDLGDVPFMSSSGLVALHSVALLMQGKEPPDPEYGWAAFRAAGRDVESDQQEQVKLLNPPERVRRALEVVGFDRYFEIYADREAAIASF
jgi:anti-anti-sigma factor